MFILWILAIVALYYLLKKDVFNGKDKSDAEETLKKRYVNGDIDEETYLRMKKEIY